MAAVTDVRVYEFATGSMTQLKYSKEHTLNVTPNKLIHATITLNSITIPGKLSVDHNTNDFGDPYVWARITKAGDQLLGKIVSLGLGPVADFYTAPATWKGRLKADAAHLTFQVQSHLAKATVVVHIFELDDELRLKIVKTTRVAESHP